MFLAMEGSMMPIIAISLWPQDLGCWTWVIIAVVLYFINVFISARMLLPVGLPGSKKPGRIKLAFILSLILSWPAIYLILMMVTGLGATTSVAGLIGALAGWIFAVAIDFVANWKLFETYFPIRQRLGGSDAYANLHRHIWGHLLAIVGIIIIAMGVFIWWVVAQLGA
jgi:hypothetical protein